MTIIRTQLDRLAAECARLQQQVAALDTERDILAGLLLDKVIAHGSGQASAEGCILPRATAPERAQGDAATCEEPAGAAMCISPREQAILRHLESGMSNKEIGRKLELSVRTVETHLRNLYLKLQVSSRARAVAAARALGLLPAEPR